MALTDLAIRNAKPAAKPYKVFDSEGLYLAVQPGGSRHWRMKYRMLGRERVLSFGAYPRITLAKAREKRTTARNLIAEGTDPAVKKKLDRIAAEIAARSTFGQIAGEFLDNMEANGLSETTRKKNRWLLEDLAAPLSKRPIGEITPAEILDLLKRVEKSGRRESA